METASERLEMNKIYVNILESVCKYLSSELTKEWRH